MIANESVYQINQLKIFNRTSQRFSQVETVSLDRDIELVQQKCRNPIICILFFVAIIAAIMYTGFGLIQGNPDRILSPIRTEYSSLNTQYCLYNVSEKFGLLYNHYLNPITNYGLMENKYCLTECPAFPINNQIRAFDQNLILPPTWSNYAYVQSISVSNTPNIYYKSVQIANRICVPDPIYYGRNNVNMLPYDYAKLFAQKVILPFTAQPISSFLLDISNNWFYLVIIVFGVSIFNILYSFVMRKCFKLSLYFSFVIIDASLFGMFLLFLYNSGNLFTPKTHQYLGVPNLLFTYEKLSFGIGCIIIMIVMIILQIIFIRKYMDLAMKIIQILGQFIIKADLSALLYRIAYFFVSLILISGFIISTYLVSINETERPSKEHFMANEKFNYANSYGLLILWIYFSVTEFTEAYYSIKYYEALFSSQNNQKTYSRIALLFGDIVLASFLKYPLQLAYVCKCFVNDIIEVKCCSDSRNLVVQLGNPQPILYQFISGKGLSECAERNVHMNWRNNKQLTMINNAKLMFLSIRLAISGLATVVSYLFMTFRPRIRNNIVQIPLALLLIFILTYIVVGSWLIYYTSALDSLYFAVIHPNQKNNQFENKQMKDIFLQFKNLLSLPLEPQKPSIKPQQIKVQDYQEEANE